MISIILALMRENRCKSCNQLFTGYYCNHCGEKVVDHNDLRLKSIAGELIGAFTFADSKFWRTIKLILFHPGQFSHQYIEGIRVKFMKPIAVFFLANLLYFIYPAVNTFDTPLQFQLNSFDFLHSPIATKMVKAKIENEQLDIERYEIQYNAKTVELSKLLLIVMVAFIALFFWITHFNRRSRIAEHFIISLEVMAFVILFCAQLLGILFYLVYWMGLPNLANEKINTLIIACVLLFFFWVIERNFYHRQPSAHYYLRLFQ